MVDSWARLSAAARIAVVAAVIAGLFGVGFGAFLVTSNQNGSAASLSLKGTTSTTSSTVVPSTTSPIPSTTTPTTTQVSTPPDKECRHAASEPRPADPNWAKMWQSQPAPDDPLTFDACIDDATPAPGQRVTVRITADDPDAVIESNACQVHIEWGDEPEGTSANCHVYKPPTDAPHPVPAEQHGHVVMTYTHKYTAAGSPNIFVVVHSGPNDGSYGPYQADIGVTLRVAVVSAPADAAPDRRCVSVNSGDPQPPRDDWAKTWQTQPATNDPLTGQICIDDVTPAAGQLVNLTIDAHDPDAIIDGDDFCQVNVYFGLDDPPGDLCHDMIVTPTGPAPTPAESEGRLHVVLRHVYASPGTGEVDVRLFSGPDRPGPHPYANSTASNLDVTVHR